MSGREETLGARWRALVEAVDNSLGNGLQLESTASTHLQKLRHASLPIDIDDQSMFEIITATDFAYFSKQINRMDDHVHAVLGKRRSSRHENSAPKLDLVAIGALNIDHIVHEWPSGEKEAAKLAALANSEVPESVVTDEAKIEEILDAVRDIFPTGSGDTAILTALGGSSYNLLRTLSDSGRGYKLGFVGVQGELVYRGMRSHRSRLAGDVNTRFLLDLQDGTHTGRCVSIMSRNADGLRERQMSVWPGANVAFSDLIGRDLWAVADYCSSARLVHVTSLFDERSPEVLADLIDIVAQQSTTTISLDPGALWSRATLASEDLLRLLSRIHVLVASSREVLDLAHNFAGLDSATSNSGARVVRASCAALLDTFPSIREIVVKAGQATHVVRRSAANLTVDSNPSMTATVDDTGAGDLFAAGFLAEELLEGRDSRTAVARGLQLGQAKIAVAGSLDGERVAELFAKEV